MIDESEIQKPKMKDLVINKETVQDLTEIEVEDARGGWVDGHVGVRRITYDPLDCAITTGG